MTGTSKSPSPRCGEDTCAGNNENYCPLCGRWICPICDTLCGFEDDDPACEHYVMEECDAWDGYEDQCQRDPETLELFDWPESLDAGTLTKIGEISPEERTERFGPFAILYDEIEPFSFFEKIAERLAIPLRRANNDESGFTIMYFSALGGDLAWERLSDARRTFNAGVTAL